VNKEHPGFKVFTSVGCADCHVPELPARDGMPVRTFSDLLLHDLGEDGQSPLAESGAKPGEWRTAPLRDLDPSEGTRRYLHDGRAATIEAAIEHHGGEASQVRDRFFRNGGRERMLLIDFVSRL
jgi:CxxC motif-containing protein (DUF1111 family)